MKNIFLLLLLFLLPFIHTVSAQTPFVFPENIKPLIATRWGQGYPFNILTPKVEGQEEEEIRPLAGCGAVAMAQILYHYRYPAWSPDQKYEYDWHHMYHRLSNDLQFTQLVSVAKLISDCGVSAFTQYGFDASSTNLSNMQNGLKRLYGYSDYMGLYSRDRFTTPHRDSLFRTMLFNELKAGRPVLYRGEKKDSKGGHLFIIDGCKGERVHVNMGWAGRRDEYYKLDDLGDFSEHQWMLVGVADTTYHPDICSIQLQTAGTLSQQLSDEQLQQTQHIAVSGPINDDDIALLKQMCQTGVLSTVNLRNASIKAIPDSAFAECSQLTHIILPTSSIRIAKCAFLFCWNLNRVVFPDSLLYIHEQAFRGCSNLFSPQLPASLQTIDQGAFYNCDGMVHAIIPEHVWKIETDAFSHCKNLISVYLPKTLRQTAQNLVRDCPKLKRFNIDPDNPFFYIEGTELKEKETK
jgi:hypothetical protein